MSSLRGHERRDFPLSARKLAFARCCRECKVEGAVNVPGVPQCENCGNVLTSGNIEYEHLDPDGLGGEPTLANCGVWCKRPCSFNKTHCEDNPRMRKADRVLKKNFGLTPAKRKIQSPGFAKAPAQRSATRNLERRS